MTDSTHHTPRLLSDADAAADLAGVARPSQGLRLLYDYGQAITASGDPEEIYMHYAAAREYIKAIEAERDAPQADWRSFIEGMEVSVDVSTDEASAENRYFGTVSEVMDHPEAKHGVILLVQNPEPNFVPLDRSAPTAVEPDERAMFEAWATGLGYRIRTWPDSGRYHPDSMHEKWEGWQARASKETP